MSCISCDVEFTAEMQSCRMSDVGTELSTIIIRTLNREIDLNAVVCDHCFSSFLRQLDLETNIDFTSHCVCCLKSIVGQHTHSLPNGQERDYIASCILPREIHTGNKVCYACWVAARRNIQRNQQRDQNRDATMHEEPAHLQPSTSYDLICVWCERNITGLHSHSLPEGLERNEIARRISPREIGSNSRVCYACWLAARRNVSREEAQDTSTGHDVQQNSQLTSLPNFKRTGNSSNTCFVHDCINEERLTVPQFLKVRLLKCYNLYITDHARVCREHLSTYDWDFLHAHNYINQFTCEQIEGTIRLALLNVEIKLDFENFVMMPEELCHYWCGLNKTNFLAILNETPVLSQRIKIKKTALALYLIKLRTGEPHTRLGQLFDLSEARISQILNIVRNSINEQFVPLHLGVNHLPRNDITNHNLIIPEGLFGGVEESGRRAIVICDGTYVYLQKSSNYLFQKKSYSLHKYRNLVKPFLIVTTDGHILDIFGPYAATVSDADIIKELLSDVNNNLRQYFLDGDVFILDRGFRDAISFLRSLNYNVCKPESLEPGETQLPTLRANKSRHVTLCRWVVEVVNGRFKRDFNIFRNEFSNTAATHLMMDFKIAGAIINAFHIPITDRPDAHLILERALLKLNEDNILGDFVVEHNINRRRVHFERINAQDILINEFPVMSKSDLILFALGTYQLKQARSYYGEHIRPNGSFEIEVVPNLEPLHIPFYENEMQLLRGRIKSRHHSGKMYYTYILLNTQQNGWEQRIHSYYCSCIAGKRTVGCCAHTMTIVWYMGWARHQPNIIAPASFLDNVLIREDIENE